MSLSGDEDSIQDGDFLPCFLRENPTVTKIIIDIGYELDYDDPWSHLWLSLDGLSRVPGLRCSSPSKAVLEWCNSTPLSKIEFTFRRGREPDEGSDLVGLELTHLVCLNCDHTFALPPEVVSEFATLFPSLRTVRFNGFFDTGHSVRLIPLRPELPHLVASS